MGKKKKRATLGHVLAVLEANPEARAADIRNGIPNSVGPPYSSTITAARRKLGIEAPKPGRKPGRNGQGRPRAGAPKGARGHKHDPSTPSNRSVLMSMLKLTDRVGFDRVQAAFELAKQLTD
jgi:hypothetical protein